MNKCRYCNKELKKSNSGGFYVCGCEKANEDWNISIIVQEYKRLLGLKVRELNKFREDNEIKLGKGR